MRLLDHLSMVLLRRRSSHEGETASRNTAIPQIKTRSHIVCVSGGVIPSTRPVARLAARLHNASLAEKYVRYAEKLVQPPPEKGGCIPGTNKTLERFCERHKRPHPIVSQGGGGLDKAYSAQISKSSACRTRLGTQQVAHATSQALVLEDQISAACDNTAQLMGAIDRRISAVCELRAYQKDIGEDSLKPAELLGRERPRVVAANAPQIQEQEQPTIQPSVVFADFYTVEVKKASAKYPGNVPQAASLQSHPVPLITEFKENHTPSSLRLFSTTVLPLPIANKSKAKRVHSKKQGAHGKSRHLKDARKLQEREVHNKSTAFYAGKKAMDFPPEIKLNATVKGCSKISPVEQKAHAVRQSLQEIYTQANEFRRRFLWWAQGPLLLIVWPLGCM